MRSASLTRCALIASLATGGAFRISPSLATNTSDASKPEILVCQGEGTARKHRDANVSGGVAILRSTGKAACLLGHTSGYDDSGVWAPTVVKGSSLSDIRPAHRANRRLPTPTLAQVFIDISWCVRGSRSTSNDDAGSGFGRVFRGNRYEHSKHLS